MVTTPPNNNHHNPPSSSMATYHVNEDDAYNGVKESSPSYYQRRGQSNNKKNGVSNFFNFSSPPSFNVHWGRQKHLRCSNQPSSSSPPQPPPPRNHNHNPDLPSSSRSTEEGNNGGGTLEVVSEKLMSDFRAEGQQIQADLPKKSDVEGETKPWNLRTRRSFCKQPNSNANAVNNGGHRKPISLPVEINGVKRDVVEVKRKRPSFSLSLSKKEIEHDFSIFAEVRPSRRPKKRSKTVQKQIDGIFPGLWLSEITADMYKVNEQPENGKSQR